MAVSAARWRRPGVEEGGVGSPVDPVRTAVVCLALQRVSYLGNGAVTSAIAGSAGSRAALPFTLAVLAHAAWSTALLITAWRRRRFPTGWVWCDVGFAMLIDLGIGRLAA